MYDFREVTRGQGVGTIMGWATFDMTTLFLLHHNPIEKQRQPTIRILYALGQSRKPVDQPAGVRKYVNIYHKKTPKEQQNTLPGDTISADIINQEDEQRLISFHLAEHK